MSVPALTPAAPGLDALRTAVDAMDALVALLDPAGRVLHVNHAWRVLAATAEAGTDPVTLATGYGGDAQAVAIAAGVRDVVEGRRESFEADYRQGPPGATRWMALRATPIAVDGVGAIVVHGDVTARRAAARATTYVEDHDGTTGLANRRLLERRLAELLAEGPVGLLALRLHGPAGGSPAPAADDDALRETAALLGRLVADDAVAGRHGADLLVVLLPGADDAALRRTALPLQAGWHARLGHRPDLALAVGSALGTPGEDAHDVLARAAMATWPVDVDDEPRPLALGPVVPVVPQEPVLGQDLDTRARPVREPYGGVAAVRLEALGRRRRAQPQG